MLRRGRRLRPPEVRARGRASARASCSRGAPGRRRGAGRGPRRSSANLREMGDRCAPTPSGCSRDVQAIHSRMVAELDRPMRGVPAGAPVARRTARGHGAPIPPAGAATVDVPEFIPAGVDAAVSARSRPMPV